jgi:hypothetical protein
MLTSVPVTTLGQVYSTLSLVQGTSGDLAALGAQLGMVAQVANTPKFAMLVQYNSSSSNGTMTAADGTALKLVADPVASVSNYIVDWTSAASNIMLGCNDNSTFSVPVGYYFWITIGGPAQIKLAASISAFAMVNASSTAGQLAAASTTAANQQTNIQATAASGGSGGKTDCYIYNF